jgi:hypothetical protein
MSLILGPEASIPEVIKGLVKCRLVVAVSNGDGAYVQATEVQTAKVCMVCTGRFTARHMTACMKLKAYLICSDWPPLH